MKLRQRLFCGMEGDNFGINAGFADSSCDELRELPPKINNEDEIRNWKTGQAGAPLSLVRIGMGPRSRTHF